MNCSFLVILVLACFQPVSTHLRGAAAPQAANSSPFAGMPEKRVEDWAAHSSDHPSKIGADQRVLDNQTAMQLGTNHGCFDDPKWRDADGDGCEIYRFAIESGKTTRELACNGGGEQPPPAQLRGKVKKVMVVTDATVKLFCRVTCDAC